MISETINLIHKDMTDEECYQRMKKLPEFYSMPADEWKKNRLIELKKRGLKWSK